jgi:hypothetical protein
VLKIMVDPSALASTRLRAADILLDRAAVALALCTGVGFLAYLAAWIIMPKDTVGAAQAAEYAGEGAR